MEGFERRRSPVEQFNMLKEDRYNPWEEFTRLPNPLDPVGSASLDQTRDDNLSSEEIKARNKKVGAYVMNFYEKLNRDT